MRIELDIGELVLDGFDPHERFAVQAAVERELVRRISAEGGLPPSVNQDREISSLDGGTFEAAPGVTGETVGSGLARALYGALSR